MHLVGFIMRLYHGARSSECETHACILMKHIKRPCTRYEDIRSSGGIAQIIHSLGTMLKLVIGFTLRILYPRAH
jgi:hypothetical protein